MAVSGFNTVVVSNDPICDGVYHMVIEMESGLAPGFLAGQWFSLQAEIDAVRVVKPYSLLRPSLAGSTRLELCYDRVPGGVMSNYLAGLSPGASLYASGPLGNFVLPTPLPRQLVFLARFTGVVPVLCMLRALVAAKESKRVRLIYGSQPGHAIFHQELERLAEDVGWFSYHPVVNRGGTEELDCLEQQLGDETGYMPMFAGAGVFTRPLRAFLKARGFARGSFKAEKFC